MPIQIRQQDDLDTLKRAMQAGMLSMQVQPPLGLGNPGDYHGEAIGRRRARAESARLYAGQPREPVIKSDFQGAPGDYHADPVNKHVARANSARLVKKAGPVEMAEPSTSPGEPGDYYGKPVRKQAARANSARLLRQGY